MLTLQQARDLLAGAAVLHGDGATRITRVHTDTRTLQPGDLFVALKGARFDAHDFLAQAREAGATAVLAERGIAACGLPGLQVADALAALQALAAAWRATMPVRLVAVAGSNGKTTVTQMLACILRAWMGETALATQGNFNNHIGVPLTLLRLRATPALTHRVGVVELGTNHIGEIAQLARITAAQVALVNNTQREHQEFLPGLQAVARENGALFEALPADGVAVFPADDPGTALWRTLAAPRRVCSFALEGQADVCGRAHWAGECWQLVIDAAPGRIETTVAIAGRHNAKNAVAAAAAALALGAPADAVAQGLAAFVPVAGRSRSSRITWQGQAATLVDDSYNANPDSVLAAIDVLADLPGPRWLLLGDMAEVGAQGPQFHAEVGHHAAARGIESVWTCGRLALHTARACGGRHFQDMDGLLAALRAQGPAARALLVKGSRSARMERVVGALGAAGQGQEDAHAA